MSPLRMIYLALAVWGGVAPLYGWLMAGDSFGVWRADIVGAGVSSGVLIAAIALTVWNIAETRVTRNWTAFWAIPATFVLGIGCGLPLYLFLRTRIA